MKKILLLYFLSLISATGYSQSCYWQQEVDYSILVDVDVDNYKLMGKNTIVYTNNSPDTLNKLYFHLYFNAFQPNSEMDIRQNHLPDPDRRIGKRISKLSEDQIGYQKIIKAEQNGSTLNHKTEGTLMELTLKESVAPGESTVIYIENEAQIPVQIRRSGRNNKEGVKLSITQWYPKIAEYDFEGWHINPYIAREFFGVYGSFDVKINIDRAYTIGGTGVLMNPEEIGHGYIAGSDRNGKGKDGKLQWHFKAENVHDFAFGADDEYIHDFVKLNGKTDLHFFYKKGSPERSKNWKLLQTNMIAAFNYMNQNFGEYPYSQFSFVQGGDGGMEYPMSTLMLGNGNNIEGMTGLAIHEALHSWYQGVLGSNEQKYPWMDEGFTTWAEDLTMNYLFGAEGENPHEYTYKSYYRIQRSGKEEPMSTPADFFTANYAYSISSYSKGAIFLAQLGYIIGDEKLKEVMLEYYNTWKFKHPAPNDLKRIAEKRSGIQLQWYLDKWVNSTDYIDYEIDKVSSQKNKTQVNIRNSGSMPMPLDISVKLKNGEEIIYYIPLRMMRGSKVNESNLKRVELPSWPWVNPEYDFVIDFPVQEIESIEIDKSSRMADVNIENNFYKAL